MTTTKLSDRDALDLIGAALAAPEWTSAASYLEHIAEILTRTNRPSTQLTQNDLPRPADIDSANWEPSDEDYATEYLSRAQAHHHAATREPGILGTVAELPGRQADRTNELRQLNDEATATDDYSRYDDRAADLRADAEQDLIRLLAEVDQLLLAISRIRGIEWGDESLSEYLNCGEVEIIAAALNAIGDPECADWLISSHARTDSDHGTIDAAREAQCVALNQFGARQ